LTGRDQPALTVVVPEAAADGLDLVTAADVEVLIVSTGPGPARAPDADVRRLTLLPLGSAYVRNRALEEANADTVVFLDNPSALAPGWLDTVREAFAHERRPAVVLASRGHADRLADALARGFVAVAVDKPTALATNGFDHRFDVEGTDGLDVAELVLRLAGRGAAVQVAPISTRTERSSARARGHLRQLVRLTRRSRDPWLALGWLARRPSTLLDVVHRHRDPHDRVLACAPREIAMLLAGADVEPFASSHPAKSHLLYRVGRERVLHVYANPLPRLRPSLEIREVIRRRAGAGIPALYAIGNGADSIWVLEALVRGEQPKPEHAAAWFPRVAEWAVALAHGERRPLAESDDWSRERDEVLGVVGERFRDPMSAALRAVEELPGAPMHGDFQRHNLRLEGDVVGVVDWEGAWLAGPPGLDLVFCSLLAAGDDPDTDLVTRLASGEDHATRPLRPYLERLGVPGTSVPALLLVLLGVWTLGEDRRRARLGGRPAPPLFRKLLESTAPLIASHGLRQP
jgi:hypothetical protein